MLSVDHSSITPEQGVEAVDHLLGALAKNKVQQLCKSTIHLCIEFILAIFTLVTSIQNKAAQELSGASDYPSYDDSGDSGDGNRRIGGAGKGNVPTQVYVISSLAALWAVYLGVSLLVVMFKKQKYTTVKEVEDTFSKANKYPFAEAFYGFILCKKYAKQGSRTFFRASVLWTLYAILLIIVLYLITHLATSTETTLTSLQIALQGFRISADVTEYMARTNLDEERLKQSGRTLHKITGGLVTVERNLGNQMSQSLQS